ncbi:vomeronasal type-1 receptor 2 [Phodopus roborovskii]|uniref:Vomeronasal type-1 receptor n=1 Tax=Phodopus roborovskii TaxID=109678 RepID=A0AAV0ACD4_PHORO|nr:vomeronasal type-1 receptor 2 [Phodopus roborovskii]CAH7400359.1 Vom1r50 [Phodopus roborovskii]
MRLNWSVSGEKIMVIENLPMGILFFSQTAVGILGNWSIFLPYVMSTFTGKSLMAKDHIIRHLTLANSLVIISRVIPHILAQLGLQNLLDDLLCKLTLYSNRVSRAISLHCTCLLGCFQAITISPSNTRFTKCKHSVCKYMVQSCSLSWLVYLLLNSKTAIDVIGSGTKKNFTKKIKLGYCSAFVLSNTVPRLHLLLLCFTDGVSLSLMIWTSVFMVNILYRHKSQLQYIHSAQHSLHISPEDRATKYILILVCTFVLSYAMSFILVIYTTLFNNPKLWIINIFTFLDTCFPTFCPFILISSNKSAPKSPFPCCR